LSVEVETIAAEQARGVAEELLRIARRGGTEADFRREAARILEDAAKKAGMDISPRDEYSVASGRIDSLYNKLVIEYKAPGKLKESNEGRTNQEIIAQTQGYILDVAKKQKKEAHRLAGVVTDGCYFIFIRRFGESWAVDEPEAVNATSTERFLRLLFTLSKGAALIPENLIENFGPETMRAWRAVRALYQALHRHTSRDKGNPLVVKLFEQWRVFFGEATDYKEWSARIESKKEFRKFVAGMKLDPNYVEAPKVFFALHTYYALLIKLVASLAAARFAGGGTTVPFAEFAGKEGDALKEVFVELERGGLFRQYGIRNFLEGDFFGWYTAAWDAQIEEAVTKIIHGKDGLSEYDPGTLELAPENARDLLKNLYHSLLPKEIRHDLGEYYTPDWLAEHVIRQTLGDADLGDATKRVLDPACGSGTFLVLLIKFIKERAAKKRQPPEKTLELILQNVVGFDLNPLAVIAARTNYLLALGDLLRHRKGDIDIPVYQCDSILAPSRGSKLFDGNVYPMETSVGEFRVPAIFAARERLDALANELDQAVEDGISADAFLARLAKNPAAALDSEEMKAAKEELLGLYSKLKELHDNGLNGVWARIIKNAFAPLFIEPCHYVVGNPPWVNWENLPDRYRERTMPLWQHYGLFPKFESGMRTILGSAKYDISMLFVYVAADRYLRRGGRLGFVISQSLFKASGAGQGFRRFILPDRTPIGVCEADDFVTIAPFEGATNRTASLVVARGKNIGYPMPYVVWRKTISGRGSRVPFDAQFQDVFSRRLRSLRWCAAPVSVSDETSAWLTVRKGALEPLRKVLGTSSYQGRAGTSTGGANAVFWVSITGVRPGGALMIANITERAKRQVPKTQASVEAELVYPLLRGLDVNRWQATTDAHILLTHKEGERLKAIPIKEMQSDFPKAFSYLNKFEKLLRSRAAFKRYFKEDAPFYSIFNIGDYTFSPWKVVWREVANDVNAAVVHTGDCGGARKTVVPDHTCILVDCGSRDEAHYVCAVLNSSPARLSIQQYIVLHPDPHVLENIKVPRFVPKNRIHEKLAELSQQAHAAAAKGKDEEVKGIEAEVDKWAAKLWGLTGEELAEILASLEEARS
jgi:SAM-dependent methyltransferase